MSSIKSVKILDIEENESVFRTAPIKAATLVKAVEGTTSITFNLSDIKIPEGNKKFLEDLYRDQNKAFEMLSEGKSEEEIEKETGIRFTQF